MAIFRKIKFLYLSGKSILIGMRVTLKNMFSPPVTLQYPLEKNPMKHNYRGMVDLVPEDCVICYQCIRICPTAALDLEYRQDTAGDKKNKEITKFAFNAELCCFCGLCEEVCPTSAIFLNQMYEVSAFAHEDLVHIDLLASQKYRHLDQSYQYQRNPRKPPKP